MNVPYVCLRCSRRLFRLKCQRRSSDFVSLGRLVERDNDSSTTATPQEVPPINGYSGATEFQPLKSRYRFPQGHQEKRKPKDVDNLLETLFASNRAHGQTLQKSRYSRTPKVQSQPTETAESKEISLKNSIELRFQQLSDKLRKETVPLQEIWRDCESLLRDISRSPKDSSDDRTLFDRQTFSIDGAALSYTFRHIVLAICHNQRLVIDGRDLTPADAIRTYRKHGVMKDRWFRALWPRVLWAQLRQVLELRYWCADKNAEADAMEKIRIMLGSMIEVWALYGEECGPRSGGFTESYSGDVEKMNDNASTSEESIAKQEQVNSRDEVSTAAAMTVECLKAAGIEAPLHITELFDQLGQAMRRDRSIATRCLLREGADRKIIEKVLEGWTSPKLPEAEKIPKSSESPNEPRTLTYPKIVLESRTNPDWSSIRLRERLKAIAGAVQRSSPKLAIALWRRFQADVEATESEAEKSSHEHVYVRFLRTFWALRRHNEAIEVWNHMISWGYPPKPKHWTAMLTGCVIAKDVKSLKSIWANMLKSGQIPEITNWTTYIHGLIDCRKWDEGLNALEQLGRIWKAAPHLRPSDTAAEKPTAEYLGDDNQETEERKFGSVLRPSENPVCGALSALIHIDKRALIPRVLAWARAHQVPLSNYTFNILLRPIVRHESQAAIQAHLQQMAEANCTPDVVTFTIILNGLVSNPTSTFHSLPPETQESTITSILADMERQGIDATPYTYTTLLDGLLTPGSRDMAADDRLTPNVQAARTVLAHMAFFNF